MARLEPLTTGQLLDRVFSFYTQNFVLFFTIALIPQAIYFVFAMVPNFALGMGMIRRGTGSAIVVTAVFLLVGLLVHLATLAMSQGASTVAVSDLYLGQATSVGKSYRQIMPISFRLMGLAIGYGMLVGFGFLLLIVPGIYWAITYGLATAVMAIERVSFSDAMSRSSDLVKGNRGRVAVIFLLSIVLNVVIVYGLGIPAALLGAVVAKTNLILGSLINLSVTMVAGALAAPIGLIGFTLAYYDARVRKEAFDLEFMMQTDAATRAALPGTGSSATAGQ